MFKTQDELDSLRKDAAKGEGGGEGEKVEIVG